jgi:aldehyde dehydrogenase (NAD+)
MATPYLKQEVFGPHVALIPFDDLDDAVRIYNDTRFVFRLWSTTSRCGINQCTGMMYFNLARLVQKVIFLSGSERSGNGNPSAAGSFDSVTHKIAVSINYAGCKFSSRLR